MRMRNPTQPGRRLGMPMDAWPLADQTAWHAAFEPADPFDDRPDWSQLRPPSRDMIATAYARWLCWLRDNRGDALARGVKERTTEEAVIAYLTALMVEISPRAVANYAASLRSALKIIAPKAEWSWLIPLIGQLQRRARAAPKTRRPFVPTDQLFAYGIEVMHAAEEAPVLDPIVRAEQFRDGLSIAFLAARPLRLKNMTGLEIGGQLEEVYGGYGVALSADVMKAHAPLEFPLPAVLVQFMHRYLGQYRPMLAAGPFGAASGYPEQAKFVWLARSGQQFPPDSFATMITSRVLSRFDVRLTPHDFRRCAATTIAEYNPEEYLIIRSILGHATITMAEGHYIQAKGIEAARLFQAVVADKRKTLSTTSRRGGWLVVD